VLKTLWNHILKNYHSSCRKLSGNEKIIPDRFEQYHFINNQQLFERSPCRGTIQQICPLLHTFNSTVFN